MIKHMGFMARAMGKPLLVKRVSGEGKGVTYDLCLDICPFAGLNVWVLSSLFPFTHSLLSIGYFLVIGIFIFSFTNYCVRPPCFFSFVFEKCMREDKTNICCLRNIDIPTLHTAHNANN